MWNESELPAIKEALAKSILRNPGDVWKAAQEVDPRPIAVQHLVQVMVMDAEVQSHIYRMRREGTANTSIIPTKEELAAKIMIETNAVRDPETKLKYYKLVADMMNYIDKPAQANVNISNVAKQTVMVVPMAQTLDEWEMSAVRQQARLVDVSAAKS